MVKINIIVAKDYDNVIGCDNKLIYNIPEDMKHFKDITTGERNNNAVIMGYNTWKSIPDKYRPLRNRFNIILTKNHKSEFDNMSNKKDVFAYESFEEALDELNKTDLDDIFIIGGESIYRQALEICDINFIYITKIKQKSDLKGEISYFPNVEYGKYKTIYVSDIKHYSKLKYQYVTLQHI